MMTIGCNFTSILFKFRREVFGTSLIKGDSNTKEDKVPLDSDSLLMLSYWFFIIIACLVTVGLSWDFWVYWKRVHRDAHHSPEQQGISSSGSSDLDHESLL